MNVSFHQLESFIKTAQLGTFAKAAAHLYITPAALIQQINTLEKQLGFKLFSRNNQGLRLTTAGEKFFQYVSAMVDGFEACVSECRFLQEDRPVIRMAYDARKTHLSWYYPYFTAFQTLYPHIHIEYIPMDSALVYENYPRNVYDFSPMSWDAGSALSLPFIPIRQIPLIIVMRSDHPLASNMLISSNHLKGETVAVHDLNHRPTVAAWGAKIPQCRLISLSSQHDHVMAHCLKGGLFLLPSLVAEELSPLVSRPIDRQIIIKYGLLYHHSTINDRLASFIQKAVKTESEQSLP